MKTFTLTCLFLLPLAAMAQNKPVVEKSVTAATSVSFYKLNHKAFINPAISFRKGELELSFGPSFLISSGSSKTNFFAPRFTGVHNTFRYLPKSGSDRVQFNFNITLTAQRIGHSWTSNFWDEGQEAYVDIKMNNIEVMLEQTLGYGFELRLAKGFCLKQGIAVGTYFSDNDGTEPIINGQLVEDLDFRGYGNFGFVWKAELGVSYRF